jgi:glyoxylase-like metal-dependent hydrolase (beta-lactamase superfamily II)
VYQDLALARLKDKLPEYLKRMRDAERTQEEFLASESNFDPDRSFLLVLREWNSFTPTIPSEGERDRGGGYFSYHGGEGIVIDPGYSFIENFYAAGGRMCDIHAIVVTHAHDDHTAELEPLLVLLHQYNNRWKQEGSLKRIRLYLSEGCARKFAGILQLRDDPKIESVTTLSRPGPGCVQTLPIGEGVRLTVLAAYHEDVVTRDTAVGLGFEFDLGDNSTRTILFTGDTSYYPQRYGPDGAPVYYDPARKSRPKLEKGEGRGLDEQYPEDFRNNLDLVVAHIGSIKTQEFEPFRPGEDPDAEHYYENHLGLLGTLTLLDRLSPRAAVVSEFGSELREFRVELVGKIGEALREKQERDGKSDKTFVVPGDVNLVYYIDSDQFLCHEDCQAHPSDELVCRASIEWKPRPSEASDAPQMEHGSLQRAHLCTTPLDQRLDENRISDYYRARYLRRLPHFKQ